MKFMPKAKENCTFDHKKKGKDDHKIRSTINCTRHLKESQWMPSNRQTTKGTYSNSRITHIKNPINTLITKHDTV